MRQRIPFLLIYSRIVIALLVVLIAYLKPSYYQSWMVVLLITGLLTDVFDGIAARKLNVSTERLRIWDSNVDQFFWILVIGCIFLLNISFIRSNFILVVIVVVLECSAYLISYIKFKRTIATHSLLAKFWTITMLVFLIDLALNSESTITFYSCIIIGIVSRVEIILIIIKLDTWATDIPSIFLVNKINRGIPIKKSKLFNS